MTETQNQSRMLMPVEISNVHFIITMSTGVSNIGVAPVDPADQPDHVHVFDKSMVMLMVDYVVLNDVIQGAEQTESQQVFMMEADHAINRGLALIRTGLKAQQQAPPTSEELLQLIRESGE